MVEIELVSEIYILNLVENRLNGLVQINGLKMGLVFESLVFECLCITHNADNFKTIGLELSAYFKR